MEGGDDLLSHCEEELKSADESGTYDVAGESFTILSSSNEDDERQSAKDNKEIGFEVVKDGHDDIERKASDVVDRAIDSASLSLRSSGDFSLLDDAPVNTTDAKKVDKEKKNDLMSDLKGSSLEEDKQKTFVDVLGNGLLRKRTIFGGAGRDTRPEHGQEVTIEYSSKLADGSIAEENQKLTFILADRDAPDALDLTVNLMERNEECEIESDSKYCFGKEGKPPSIPPDASLTYNVKLLEITEGPYNSDVAIEKRLDWVDAKRTKGNNFYSKQKFPEAAMTYLKCTRVLQKASNQKQSDEVMSQINSYSVKCNNNLAASQMKLGKWKEGLQSCIVSERIDPTNVKTLFRKGKILAELGNTGKSIAALKKAAELSPNDKAILVSKCFTCPLKF
ncbi:unnamed protein product [Clavelina lepadiformis]|uniref:peptidylprolyl isomerase n=1 Tax=Clavelina lepadiformis TaxID=159417 RepID=A0ABP0FML3_CLALP